jgi:hypothetical protein
MCSDLTKAASSLYSFCANGCTTIAPPQPPAPAAPPATPRKCQCVRELASSVYDFFASCCGGCKCKSCCCCCTGRNSPSIQPAPVPTTPPPAAPPGFTPRPHGYPPLNLRVEIPKRELSSSSSGGEEGAGQIPMATVTYTTSALAAAQIAAASQAAHPLSPLSFGNREIEGENEFNASLPEPRQHPLPPHQILAYSVPHSSFSSTRPIGGERSIVYIPVTTSNEALHE